MAARMRLLRAAAHAGARLPQMRPAFGGCGHTALLQCGARAMSGLAGTQTLDKFRDAFAGKSMATVRYTYMAQQADVEGETDAASVFRAVGESEDNHAMGHLEFLQDTGDPVANQPITNTLEMLQAAIISENHDASTMYPEFARVAREEGLEEVAEWFDTLSVAEGIHLRRFQRLLEDLPDM